MCKVMNFMYLFLKKYVPFVTDRQVYDQKRTKKFLRKKRLKYLFTYISKKMIDRT